MALRFGKDIVLMYKNASDKYEQFALSSSCEISIKRDMQEVASSTSGQAKEYIPGRYSWTMSFKSLLSDDNSVIENFILNKTLIDVQWLDNTPGASAHEALSGKAYIKDFKANGKVHDMASCQATLQGTGTLTRTR